MPLSLMALRERFIQHPLLPTAVVEQQNRWRERWGMQPRSPEPGEDWRYYFDPTTLHDGRPDANDPRNRLRFELVSDTGRQKTSKYFLTGSKGSGKSTTAYSLWDDPKIASRYTLVGFTIHDYLNLVDTDASQIIAVMIAHLHEMLHDAKEDAKLGDLEARATVKGLDKLMRSLRPNIKVEQLNVNWFGLFTAMFKESAAARAEFTKYIKGQMEEVQALFDELNGLLEASTAYVRLQGLAPDFWSVRNRVHRVVGPDEPRGVIDELLDRLSPRLGGIEPPRGAGSMGDRW